MSSLKLALDTYIPNESSDTNNYVKASEIFDIVINCFFTLEAILKILSLGFVLDEESYLRDIWNKIDFTIVITSLIGKKVFIFCLISLFF